MIKPIVMKWLHYALLGLTCSGYAHLVGPNDRDTDTALSPPVMQQPDFSELLVLEPAAQPPKADRELDPRRGLGYVEGGLSWILPYGRVGVFIPIYPGHGKNGFVMDVAVQSSSTLTVLGTVSPRIATRHVTAGPEFGIGYCSNLKTWWGGHLASGSTDRYEIFGMRFTFHFGQRAFFSFGAYKTFMHLYSLDAYGNAHKHSGIIVLSVGLGCAF